MGAIGASTASGALVYQRRDTKPLVARRDIFAARADGSEAHVVARGFAPRISPKGHWIAYFTPGGSEGDKLHLVGVHGRHRRLLMLAHLGDYEAADLRLRQHYARALSAQG